MSPLTVAGALVGMLTMAGVLMLLSGLRPRPARPSGPGLRLRRRLRVSRRAAVLLGAGTTAGVVAALLTGVVPLLVAVPAAVAGLPWLLGAGPGRQELRWLEALEAWARRLATLLSSHTLESAVIRSVGSVSPDLAPYVTRLAARLESHVGTERALLQLADELDDETADKICATLVLAARNRSAGMPATLTDLAGSVGADVRARRRIETERARDLSATRQIVGIMVGTLVVMTVAFADFMEPYTTPAGQLLLALNLTVLGGVLVWRRRLADSPPPTRFLREEGR